MGMVTMSPGGSGGRAVGRSVQPKWAGAAPVSDAVGAQMMSRRQLTAPKDLGDVATDGAAPPTSVDRLNQTLPKAAKRSAREGTRARPVVRVRYNRWVEGKCRRRTSETCTTTSSLKVT
jgi:hypothetical protein